MSKLDFDRLDVFAKKDKLELIEKCYSRFAWEKVQVSDNTRYEDLVDVTFQRAHKVPHKDDLQLMQIYMESCLNRIGRLESTKHSRSTILGLALGIFSLAMCGLGLWLIISIATTLSIIFGAIAVAVGVALLVLTTLLSVRLFKRERGDFEDKKAKLDGELESICSKAEQLIKGEISGFECKKS